MIHAPFMKPIIGTTLKTGLVSVWEMNKTTGIIMCDSHASNDGDIIGATINQTGKLDKAYDFTPTGEYVKLDSFTMLPSATTTSWSFWVYPEVLSGGTTFSTTNPRYLINEYGTNFTYIRLLGDIFDVGVTNGTYKAARSASGLISANEWVHLVAVVIPSAKAKLYINGSLVSNSTKDDTFPATWTTKTRADIGGSAYYGHRYFDGLLDQTAVWSKELTTKEIATLNNSNNGLAYVNW